MGKAIGMRVIHVRKRKRVEGGLLSSASIDLIQSRSFINEANSSSQDCSAAAVCGKSGRSGIKHDIARVITSESKSLTLARRVVMPIRQYFRTILVFVLSCYQEKMEVFWID